MSYPFEGHGQGVSNPFPPNYSATSASGYYSYGSSGNLQRPVQSQLYGRYSRNPPSDLILIRGLPAHTGELVISSSLSAMFPAVTTEFIRVVREKNTGQSKGFALVKFSSVDDAQAFMLAFEASSEWLIDGAPVWLEFGVEQRPDDWNCKICGGLNFYWRTACYKCAAGKGETTRLGKMSGDESISTMSSVSNPSSSQLALNDGSQDECSNPSTFLVLRRLDPSFTSPQPIFEALLRTQCEEVERVWLVKDCQTGKSRRFAFAEFSSIQSSSRALEKLRSDEGKLSFLSNLAVETDSELKNSPYLETILVSYGRDLHALNAMFMGTGAKPSSGLSYWDPLLLLEEYPKQEQKDSVDKLVAAAGSSNNNNNGAIPGAAMASTVVGAFTVTNPISSSKLDKGPKKIQMQFKKWESRANEMQSLQDEAAADASIKSLFVKESKQEDKLIEEGTKPKANESSCNNMISRHSFADYVLKACFICQRQFDTRKQLDRHVLESELHRANIDMYKRLEAEQEIEGEAEQDGINNTDKLDGMHNYRNRAAERREIYQTGFPEANPKSKGPKEREWLPSEPERGENFDHGGPKIDSTSNVGAKLLMKMGWKEGEGLGKDKSGIVEPIRATGTVGVKRNVAGIGNESWTDLNSRPSEGRHSEKPMSYKEKVKKVGSVEQSTSIDMIWRYAKQLTRRNPALGR